MVWRGIGVLSLSVMVAAGCGPGGATNGTAGTIGTAGTTGGAGPGGSAGTGPSCTPPLMPGSGISVVTGPQVGIGTVANSALRKAITARDTSSNPAFVVTGAWLVDPTMRPNMSLTSIAFVFFAVTNRGGVPLCQIQLSNLVYRNAAGASINAMLGVSETSNSASVVGGTGVACAGTDEAWPGCLAPGESSFAWNVFNFPGATVASTPIVGADFAILATTGLADGQPDFKLVVQSYTIGNTAGTTLQSLSMAIMNQGSAPAALSEVPWFLLDDQGAPLDYSAAKFLSITLAPGDSALVVDPAVEFDGAGTRVAFSPQGGRP